MVAIRHLLISALAAAAVSTACAAADARPHARVSEGELVGVKDGSVSAFLGIPYAASPTGSNRWRAPQPAPHWNGVRSAGHFGASCYQVLMPGFGPWTPEYEVSGAVSEDCLFLNVWSPDPAAGRHLPVMVWIPGGAFIGGSGSVPIYDGTNLAARGIVVVTINYRLGVFGFLAHPQLTAEAKRDREPPGNFGLQDMIAALNWIRANVSAFGGDPRSVTIAGESAGSIAVHELIASPMSAGLFQRAIAESGFGDTVPLPSLAQAERVGEGFARQKGATSLAALRALPAKDLVSASPTLRPWFTPIVDGAVLPAPPQRLLAQGRSADTPLLLGMNADENTGFTRPLGPVSRADWDAFLRKTFGTSAPQFEALYPAHTDVQRGQAMRLLRRDLGLAVFQSWSQSRLAHSHCPAYGYLWTHAEPGVGSGQWGAFHASEMPYVFDTLAKAPERHFTALDQTISDRVSSYWLNFIKTGNPNGAGLPVWPRLSPPTFAIMQLGSEMSTRSMLPSTELTVMKSFERHGGTPLLFVLP